MKHLAAITFLVLWSSVAAAQSKPDVSALEASGNKHFELAEYDAAITDFKEAFRISDEPGFLYNIAQAYRLKNDCREAATFYKNYLRRVPNAPNAAKVRQRIAEMEKCAETQPPPATVPPPTTTTQVQPPTEPAKPGEPAKPNEQPTKEPAAPPPPNPRGWMKWAGIGSIAAGAVSGGLAIKFALDGKSANDDLAKLCATSCTGADAKKIEADGHAANRNAVIAAVAGGALIGAGVVLVVLSRQSSAPANEEADVSLQLTHGGATAGYAWHF